MKIKLLVFSLAAAAIALAPSSMKAATTTAPAKTEPAKSMEAAKTSFVAKDLSKASHKIKDAAKWVKKESCKVEAGSKAAVLKAGDDLDKLADGVKSGAVKSGQEINKAFAKTNCALAQGWKTTAEKTQQAGKDARAALTKSADYLVDAAKWSGTKLDQGTRATITAIKSAATKTADVAKAGTNEVKSWIGKIGHGIRSIKNKM